MTTECVGSLVCVVGRIGTGKTSLLAGLLGDLALTKGFVEFGGTVSYGECHAYQDIKGAVDRRPVPQQAWIQSGSVRDNITLNQARGEVNQERLVSVISACGLEEDLNRLQDGVE